MIQKRGEVHLAFAMYKNCPKLNFDTNALVGQTSENPSVYTGFRRFALSITTVGSNKVLSAAENLFSSAA